MWSNLEPPIFQVRKLYDKHLLWILFPDIYSSFKAVHLLLNHLCVPGWPRRWVNLSTSITFYGRGNVSQGFESHTLWTIRARAPWTPEPLILATLTTVSITEKFLKLPLPCQMCQSYYLFCGLTSSYEFSISPYLTPWILGRTYFCQPKSLTHNPPKRLLLRREPNWDLRYLYRSSVQGRIGPHLLIASPMTLD